MKSVESRRERGCELEGGREARLFRSPGDGPWRTGRLPGSCVSSTTGTILLSSSTKRQGRYHVRPDRRRLDWAGPYSNIDASTWSEGRRQDDGSGRRTQKFNWHCPSAPAAHAHAVELPHWRSVVSAEAVQVEIFLPFGTVAVPSHMFQAAICAGGRDRNFASEQADTGGLDETARANRRSSRSRLERVERRTGVFLEQSERAGDDQRPLSSDCGGNGESRAYYDWSIDEQGKRLRYRTAGMIRFRGPVLFQVDAFRQIRGRIRAKDVR